MAAGLPELGRLKEARSKLVPAESPPTVRGPKELGERFALRGAGHFGQLLARAEAHILLRSSIRGVAQPKLATLNDELSEGVQSRWWLRVLTVRLSAL